MSASTEDLIEWRNACQKAEAERDSLDEKAKELITENIRLRSLVWKYDGAMLRIVDEIDKGFFFLSSKIRKIIDEVRE